MEQISFLDDFGLVRSDCICRTDTFCALCGTLLSSRKRVKKIYWLAGLPPRRICRKCYNLYVKSFDTRFSVWKRGSK